MSLCALVLASSVITNAADLTATLALHVSDVRFELQGMMTKPRTPREKVFLFEDASGAAAIDSRDWASLNTEFAAGDIVRVSGTIYADRRGFSVPLCDKIVRLDHRKPPKPMETTIADIKRGKVSNRIIRLRGVIRDIFADEIDPTCRFLILTEGDDSIYMSLHTEDISPEFLARLVDSEVSVVGSCNTLVGGSRLMIGHTVGLSADSLTILRPAPADAFDVPEIEQHWLENPEKLAIEGRRRVRGRVIAVWHTRQALVSDAHGRIHRLDIADGEPPRFGNRIEAVGIPETDLYRINLSSAKWRHLAGSTSAPTGFPEVVVASAAEILVDKQGNRKIKPKFHGQFIRMRGTVQSIPSAQNRSTVILFRSGDFTIPLDITSCPELAERLGEGDEIEAIGCCIVESENWKSYSTFPKTSGIVLAVSRPTDVRVLAHPPWWTPARLRTAIGTLLAGLVAILIWNLLLRRAVERRSRALEKEITARIGSDLKVYERTRLAVELHDSLAQNLSGVSLEIDAASDFAKENTDEMMRHLGIASSALKSCRDELRNCLWDLRNQSLEDEDMDTAIRRTLTPHLGGANLSVRFNVPRARLPDNVAHAILRIIRELTVNAVRHGHAKVIKVAGCIEDEHLLFSVRDNGCGFDPDNHPGVEQGHYGLQGISERAEDLDGDMTIESEPGHGSKITVRIDATPNTKMTNEQ